MQKRLLGKSGIEVSAIELGCMGLNFRYGHALSNAQSVTMIRQAVLRGETHFDAAEVYGSYTNEEIFGEALKSVRDHGVIATEVGCNIIDGNTSARNSRRGKIRKVGDASLKSQGNPTRKAG